MAKKYAILSIIAFLSYTIPLIVWSIQDFMGKIPEQEYSYTIIDRIYSIGSTFAFGGIFILISKELKNKYDYMTMSAGIWFAGLCLIYLFDWVFVWMSFETYDYVMFNVLITLVAWCIILRPRKSGSRQ